jgi:hypothetical protein
MSWSLGKGRHLVTVIDHQLGKSGTGTPYVAVQFESDVQLGDRITWYGYLTDAAFERTVASLQVLGWDPAAHNGLIASLNGTGLLKGAPAEIVLDEETHEGKTRMKVKWVNAPGGGGLGEAMAADDAKGFSESIRFKILSAAKPQPSSRPGPAKQAAVGGGRPLSQPDDDLPFAPMRLLAPWA